MSKQELTPMLRQIEAGKLYTQTLGQQAQQIGIEYAQQMAALYENGSPDPQKILEIALKFKLEQINHKHVYDGIVRRIKEEFGS